MKAPLFPSPAAVRHRRISTGPAVAKLEKDILVLMNEAIIPGMAAALIEHGEGWYGPWSYGVRNSSTGNPYTAASYL